MKKTLCMILVIGLWLWLAGFSPFLIGADEDLIELKYVGVYPAEDEEDTWNKSHWAFDVDEEGNVFAFDPNNHHWVSKLNPQGKLVKVIGRKGEGPGDLYRPNKVIICQDKMAIRDFNSVSIFTLDGEYISRFRVFNPVFALTMDQDKVYTIEKFTPHLMTVYDFNGKKLSTFGKKYEVDYSKFRNRAYRGAESFIHGGDLFNTRTRLLYFPQLFGEAHFFDKKGTFLGIKKIPGMNEELIKKYRWHYIEDKARRYYNNSVALLYSGISICDEHLYTMDLGRDLYNRIVEYDPGSFQPVKRYKYYYIKEGKKIDFTSIDIVIKKRGNTKLFYISVIEDEEREASIRLYKEE